MPMVASSHGESSELSPGCHSKPGASASVLSATARATAVDECELTPRPTSGVAAKFVKTTGSPTWVQELPSVDIDPMKVLRVRIVRNHMGATGALTFVTAVLAA